MSDRIKLLPEIVANQIAAGEVVEEPASAVKEMMENAIDAGARKVVVNFRNGGLELIQIVDDGCGMSPIDARMAFDRHTTSKISSFDDIYALRTFGFRGEALASISAVSQVELRTRQEGDEVGTETIIAGGEFISQKPVLTPVGSNFSVRNLFYNTPARRKKMDKASDLATNIKREFRRVALCYPERSFELYSNDQPVMSLPASTLSARIVSAIGNHIRNNLLEVAADTSIVKIKGYVGHPSVAKKRNNEQYFFVNGRFFQSPYLNKAILKAFEKLIPESCFPSYFIYITVDPERVDVNITPKKTQVKFDDTEHIWQILHAAVRETLAKTGAVPMIDFDNQSDIEIPISDGVSIYGEPRAAVNEYYNPFDVENEENGGASAAKYQTAASKVHSPKPQSRAYESLVPNEEFAIPSSVNDTVMPEYETFGEFESFESPSNFGREQELSVSSSMTAEAERPYFASVTYVGNGYASALYGGKFVVADLKRARERVLYDDYMRLLGGSSSVSQQLLFPERLVLSNDEYALLQEHSSEFTALGFDLEFTGEDTVLVHGIPAETADDSVDQLLYELLRAIETPVSAAELRRERIALAMARNGSSRTPRNITAEEAAAMLDRLAASDNVSFTPSGKVIFAEITADDIRRRLG